MGIFIDRLISSMKMNEYEDVEYSDEDEYTESDEQYEDDSRVSYDDVDVSEVERKNKPKKSVPKNKPVNKPIIEEIDEDGRERRGFFGKRNTYDTIEEESTRIVSVEPTRRQARSVRNLPAVQGKVSEVKMITPLTYDEAKDIVTLLIEGKAVVLNLERIKVDIGQKIIDFTAGACFTMGGDMQSISKKIFIATPSTMELSGDFTSILTGNGTMDFSMLNLNT